MTSTIITGNYTYDAVGFLYTGMEMAIAHAVAQELDICDDVTGGSCKYHGSWVDGSKKTVKSYISSSSTYDFNSADLCSRFKSDGGHADRPCSEVSVLYFIEKMHFCTYFFRLFLICVNLTATIRIKVGNAVRAEMQRKDFTAFAITSTNSHPLLRANKITRPNAL